MRKKLSSESKSDSERVSRKQSNERIYVDISAIGFEIEKKAFTNEGHENSNEAVKIRSYMWFMRIFE